MTDLLVIALSIATLANSPAMTGFADGPDIVEVLKDAQATNRDAWKRGQAAVRLEITRKESPGVAIMEGDVRWLDANYILRYKVSDPEAVWFHDRGKSMDLEWNYIAKGSKKVITYLTRYSVLNEREPTPSAIEPLYDLAPPTNFSRCCPPYGLGGRPWTEMIGPSADTPEVFRSSKFSHITLPNGDIEQTRVDERGSKVVTVFSARDNLAPRSSVSFTPAGKLNDELEYRYSKRADGVVLPAGATRMGRSEDLSREITYHYVFSDVRVPGDVSPADFERDSILNRLRRETNYGRPVPVRAQPVVNDAKLDEAAKSLRKDGSARPKP